MTISQVPDWRSPFFFTGHPCSRGNRVTGGAAEAHLGAYCRHPFLIQYCVNSPIDMYITIAPQMLQVRLLMLRWSSSSGRRTLHVLFLRTVTSTFATRRRYRRSSRLNFWWPMIPRDMCHHTQAMWISMAKSMANESERLMKTVTSILKTIKKT